MYPMGQSWRVHRDMTDHPCRYRSWAFSGALAARDAAMPAVGRRAHGSRYAGGREWRRRTRWGGPDIGDRVLITPPLTWIVNLTYFRDRQVLTWILRQAQDERGRGRVFTWMNRIWTGFECGDVGDGGSFWSGFGLGWWVVGFRQRFRVVVSIRPVGTQSCLAPDSVH